MYLLACTANVGLVCWWSCACGCVHKHSHCVCIRCVLCMEILCSLSRSMKLGTIKLGINGIVHQRRIVFPSTATKNHAQPFSTEYNNSTQHTREQMEKNKTTRKPAREIIQSIQNVCVSTSFEQHSQRAWTEHKAKSVSDYVKLWCCVRTHHSHCEYFAILKISICRIRWCAHNPKAESTKRKTTTARNLHHQNSLSLSHIRRFSRIWLGLFFSIAVESFVFNNFQSTSATVGIAFLRSMLFTLCGAVSCTPPHIYVCICTH